MRFNTQCVTHFGRYLEQRGICSIHQLEGASGKELLAAYRDHLRGYKHWRRDAGLKLYIQALEEAGVIAPRPSRDASLFQETRQYIIFLKSQKGLNDTTIQYHIYWTQKFLHFIGYQENASSLLALGIADVDRFIEDGASQKPVTQEHLTGVLRSFLRFLHQSGRISNNLAPLIIRPRRYRLGALPRVLDWEQVQRILDNVDRSTRSGRQHYAILILLAMYGLRAGEVANLKLEDIDWRRETIHIASRKAGKDLCLPLIAQVGKAILDYLKHGRPGSKDRHVFFLTRAPWTPLNRHNVAYVVNRHIELSGLKLSKHGPHLLRPPAAGWPIWGISARVVC
jgi:integrase/recombinase XerD